MRFARTQIWWLPGDRQPAVMLQALAQSHAIFPLRSVRLGFVGDLWLGGRASKKAPR
jgi:hypothetical protein